MLFGSLYFLAFMVAVLAAYWTLRSWEARKRLLLGASWAFYATWSPAFLPVLVATTWLDFHLARWIYRLRWDAPGVERDGGIRRARGPLVLSLAVNLGLLAFFKYGRFVYESIGAVAWVPPTPAFLSVAVPLGISFYTFHSISYVIDTYRGARPPTDSLSDFALYVAFFPQLISGPITRWGFFGPQLDRARRVRFEHLEGALLLLGTGLLKKVVFADSLGAFVDTVYGDPIRSARIEIWLALYAYAFQIYFDFSGYTDIAWGVAGLLGFALPENFRHPYVSESPSEFWRRWHISLSTWLRDYLYIPLGGNRLGRTRTYVNLLVTMLLGGLWHGAAWTFVAWGGFHGGWLAVHRAIVERRPGPPRTPRWLRRLVTFHLVTFGWVLFRAGTFENVGYVLRGLFAAVPLSGPFPVAPAVLVLLGFATHALALRADVPAVWRRVPRLVQGVAYGIAIVLIGLCSVQSQRFIYFQF
jgi:alginate O-acetyltransferase complex protein AlgI